MHAVCDTQSTYYTVPQLSSYSTAQQQNCTAILTQGKIVRTNNSVVTPDRTRIT